MLSCSSLQSCIPTDTRTYLRFPLATVTDLTAQGGKVSGSRVQNSFRVQYEIRCSPNCHMQYNATSPSYPRPRGCSPILPPMQFNAIHGSHPRPCGCSAVLPPTVRHMCFTPDSRLSKCCPAPLPLSPAQHNTAQFLHPPPCWACCVKVAQHVGQQFSDPPYMQLLQPWRLATVMQQSAVNSQHSITQSLKSMMDNRLALVTNSGGSQCDASPSSAPGNS